jgi:methionyl-tRNA formyltransferase
MKIGITTFDPDNLDFRVQLSSLLEENIEPDFIILHYGGSFGRLRKYFRFIVKVIRQFRINSFMIILRRLNKSNRNSASVIHLTRSQEAAVDAYLRRSRIIKTMGINDRSTIRKIRDLESALIVCNSGVLKEKVLNLPDKIFLNIHASELPRYRGMNNVEWALYENNALYVTVHKISRGIDEGDILYQEKIDLRGQNLKQINDYRQYCFFKSNQTTGKAIKKLINNEIAFVEQEKKQEPLMQYYVMHPVLRKRLQERLHSE